MSPEQYEKFQKANPRRSGNTNFRGSRHVRLAWYQGKLSKSTYIYWPFRDEITCLDGLLFKGHKVIITDCLWKEMLDRNLSFHLGIVKCPICAVYSKMNPKEPLMECETPSRPWSIISAALFDFQGQWHSYFLWSLPKMAIIFQTGKTNQLEHYSTSEKNLITWWYITQIHVR